MSGTSVAGLLSPKLIQLAARPASKADAIEQAAALLVAAGIVAPGYGASMQKREAVANTFLGHGIAIPPWYGRRPQSGAEERPCHFAGARWRSME